jgi:hypothetical protein
VLVSTAALEETFGAAGSSVKLVVLDACHGDLAAELDVGHLASGRDMTNTLQVTRMGTG